MRVIIMWEINEDDLSYLHFIDKLWKVKNLWREDDAILYAALLHKADRPVDLRSSKTPERA